LGLESKKFVGEKNSKIKEWFETGAETRGKKHFGVFRAEGYSSGVDMNVFESKRVTNPYGAGSWGFLMGLNLRDKNNLKSVVGTSPIIYKKTKGKLKERDVGESCRDLSGFMSG